MQHLDEGTIHAWLDGALPAAEGAAVEAHAAACAECAARVAEARGLIAGASGILTALDDVPAGVIPGRAAAPEEALRAALAAARAEMGDAPGVRDLHDARQRRTRRSWLAPAPLRAAAAVAFVALGGLAVLRARGPAERADEMMASASRTTLSADTAVMAPSAAPLPAPAPAAGRTAAAEAAAPRAERVAVPPPRAPTPAAPEPAGNLAATGAAGGAAGGADAAAGAAQDAAVRQAAPSAAREEQAFAARARTDAQRKAVASVAPSAPALASAKAGTRRVAVEGRVTDAGSGGPVEGAQVLLEEAGKTAVTDSDGRFVIADASPGTHTAQVRRMGYASETQTVRVDADSAAELRVALEAAGTMLQGQAVAAAPEREGARRTAKAAAPIPGAPEAAADAASALARANASAANEAVTADTARPAAELAGCYELSFGAWTPAMDDADAAALPRVVALDTVRAAAPTGAAYRMRTRTPTSAGGLAGGSWVVIPGAAGAADLLSLRWSAGERTLEARLARDGTSLRGIAHLDARGDPARRSVLRAARASCPPAVRPPE